MESAQQIDLDLPSRIFIVWFIAWLLALLILPRSYFDALFFSLGLFPVIGWFLVKPKTRLLWLARVLLGFNGLDKQ